jgi:hypothetical protein
MFSQDCAFICEVVGNCSLDNAILPFIMNVLFSR